MSPGINWDEYTERMWTPLIGAPPVVYEGNLARAIVKKSVFVLLVIPKNITTGEYDPEWAELLKREDGSQRTVVFYDREDAFQFAMKYIEDPWQLVEI
jgi:hypothetical protein